MTTMTGLATPVTLSFAGELGGRPFDCGASVAGIGAAGPWQQEGLALLDFEDATGACRNGTPQTNTEVRGSAPPGDYAGVAFDVGVPFDDNHADPTLAASPLNLTAMFWSWRGGYRFLRVDVVVQGTGDGPMPTDGAEPRGHGHGGHDHGAAGEWALHLGSTGCVAAAPTQAPERCAAPNRVAVVLPDFDPSGDTLVVDPARVLEAVDVASNAPGTSPGCMSAPDDPDCGPVLRALGLGEPGAAQSLVRAR